ncbi:MAG: thiamine pyrophosphate-dependent dehydrogenase E1 component subunit alpha [Gemmatimonadota bacterium]
MKSGSKRPGAKGRSGEDGAKAAGAPVAMDEPGIPEAELEVQIPEAESAAVDTAQAAREAGDGSGAESGEDAGWTTVYSGRTATVAREDDPEAQAPEAPSPREALDPAWPEEVKLYYWMRLSRAFEDRCGKLYRQGEIKGGLYSGVGQEATTVGVGAPLEDGDFVSPLHRDMGLFLMRGADPRRLMAQIMGRATGYSRGHDSWTHAGDLARGIFGSVSHLGATLPVIAGAALAFRQRGEDRVAVGTFGEGTSSRGDFHEAANFVGIHKLACIFVCVNNQYAYSTPPHLSFPTDHVADRATAYGMFGEVVDGNDLGDVLKAMRRAVRRARGGEGPSLLECVTFRLRGHSEHDQADYVDKDELLRWKAKGPVERWERYLQLKGHELDTVRAQVDPPIEAIMKDAVAFAKRSPFADPAAALEDLYLDPVGEADPASEWMRGHRGE